ncbi:hypothetical protein ACIP79_40885 [Streptomyces sp. NPDC088747]|uniref:hypothetical protein n=1 Tax=Streptomyces sp. NPDC088747 TaxID=3365886 RepID=UPI0037F65560
MTPCHAAEILLTRPASPGELRHVRCSSWLAVNADRTRLKAVQRAASPGAALHLLRRQLDTPLPIDVVSTHYPDRHGQVLLNVPLDHTAGRAPRRDAAARGQRSRGVLRQHVAIARAREEECLKPLLTDHTPEEVLAGGAALLHKEAGPRSIGRAVKELSSPLPGAGSLRHRPRSSSFLFHGVLVAHPH